VDAAAGWGDVAEPAAQRSGQPRADFCAEPSAGTLNPFHGWEYLFKW